MNGFQIRCRAAGRQALPALAGLLLMLSFGGAAAAAPPEIAHVHPGFMGPHSRIAQPLLLTGEGFDVGKLEVWTWAPPMLEEKELLEVLRRAGGKDEPALPGAPPAKARRATILDVEKQIVLADIYDHPRTDPQAVIWVRHEGEKEYSRPYLNNVAQPKWINRGVFRPGELLRIFGFGLSVTYRPSYVALRAGTEVRLLDRVRDPFYRMTDPGRIFESVLPSDLKTGRYELFVHNAYGGQYGWQKAGDIEIKATPTAPERMFNVRDMGAKGDGAADDTEALEKVLGEAAAAGGGIVYLPPGNYLIRRSLQVPSHVILRGSSRQDAIIRGVGYGRGDNLRAVLLLAPYTGLESLSVTGAVKEGGGGAIGGLVQLTEGEVTDFPPGVRRGMVAVRDIRIERPFVEDRSFLLYSSAFQAAGGGWNAPAYRVEVLHSEFNGNVMVGHGKRIDIIGNKIEHGAVQCGALIDSYVADNIMRDYPERFYSYRPVINTYFAANEIYNFGTRRGAGASESFMLHGGDALTGKVSSAGADTLTDTARKWEPDDLANRHQVVMITAGRGFGQYRRVVGNSADTLKVDRPWRVVPDAGSEYNVGGYFVDSVFYDNYNSGVGRMSIYGNSINVTVDSHRDDNAGGIDIWAFDRSGKERAGGYLPSWYNMFTGNSLEGSRINIVDSEAEGNLWRGPVVFGNYIVGNNVVRPLFRNVGMSVFPTAAIDAGGIIREGVAETWRSGRRSSHTVLYENTVTGADIGIRVPKGTRKTLLRDNAFLDINHPIVDLGDDTIWGAGNRIRRLDPVSGQMAAEEIVQPAR